MSRIATTFDALKAQGRKALIPFVTAGDPHPAATVALMQAMAEAGADVIELGVPFSDPMADGPVIQRAGERALRVSLKNCARVPRTVHYESHSSRLSLDARAGDGGAVPITDTHANQKFDNTVYCLDVHRFLPGEERLLTDAQVSRVEGNLVVGVDGLVATGDREGSLEVRIAFTSRATKCREGFQERDAPWRPIADVWIGTVSAPPVVGTTE